MVKANHRQGVLQKTWRYSGRWIWYCLASETIQFLQLVVYLCLGIYWTTVDRQWGQLQMSEAEAEHEDEIGFGQLVPIFLLLLPLLQMVEVYSQQPVAPTTQAHKQGNASDNGQSNNASEQGGEV
jgi:hypothetical protein